MESFIYQGENKVVIKESAAFKDRRSIAGLSTQVGGSNNTRKASNFHGDISPGFGFDSLDKIPERNRQRQYSEVLHPPNSATSLAARRNFKMLTPTFNESKYSKKQGQSKDNINLKKKKQKKNLDQNMNGGEYLQKGNPQQLNAEEEDSPFLKSNLLKKFYVDGEGLPQKEGVLVNETIQPFEKNQPLQQQYWFSQYDSDDIRLNGFPTHHE